MPKEDVAAFRTQKLDNRPLVSVPAYLGDVLSKSVGSAWLVCNAWEAINESQTSISEHSIQPRNRHPVIEFGT